MQSLTRPHSSAIHEDSPVIPTPDPTYQTQGETIALQEDHDRCQEYGYTESEHVICAAPVLSHADADEDGDFGASLADGGVDGDRRVSAFARTSISSLPESTFETDNDRAEHVYEPSYRSPTVRPSFRRPDSVLRMHMSSPGPFDRSPRKSVLRHPRSRTGTPRSVRTSARGSPRSKRAVEQNYEDEDHKAEYPLVLLHVTLLPVKMYWSASSMEELVPPHVLENLRLLRSKVSETILQRGILISHPREEYELLEERLLEALELRDERVTKCGHFRNRESTSSSGSSRRDSDSGFGSTAGDIEAEICRTCHSRVKLSKTGVGEGLNRWSVKVFAANGLLRASAWSAIWSEMESVDVEILPWMDEDLVRKLDERFREEEAHQERRQAEDQARLQQLVEEQIRVARDATDHVQEAKSLIAKQLDYAQPLSSDVTERSKSRPSRTVPVSRHRSSDLPEVYRREDIPLSVLLKNYFYLLAQDRRTVVIFALAMVAFWLSLRAVFLPTGTHDVGIDLATTSLLDETDSTALPYLVDGDTDVEQLHLEDEQNSVVDNANMSMQASEEMLFIDDEFDQDNKLVDEGLSPAPEAVDPVAIIQVGEEPPL